MHRQNALRCIRLLLFIFAIVSNREEKKESPSHSAAIVSFRCHNFSPHCNQYRVAWILNYICVCITSRCIGLRELHSERLAQLCGGGVLIEQVVARRPQQIGQFRIAHANFKLKLNLDLLWLHSFALHLLIQVNKIGWNTLAICGWALQLGTSDRGQEGVHKAIWQFPTCPRYALRISHNIPRAHLKFKSTNQLPESIPRVKWKWQVSLIVL